MEYQIYRTLTLLGRRWRWRLVAANGRIIASGESFNSYAACVDSVDLFRASANAPVRSYDSDPRGR